MLETYSYPKSHYTPFFLHLSNINPHYTTFQISLSLRHHNHHVPPPLHRPTTHSLYHPHPNPHPLPKFQTFLPPQLSELPTLNLRNQQSKTRPTHLSRFNLNRC
ncbi:unnamed protein product [Lupinus luteus]|uniref:Uncharacterized protein n=1 Tax=Lupinus luteus TaxID=3873 RepID=A0AAV1XWD9_LUPLU